MDSGSELANRGRGLVAPRSRSVGGLPRFAKASADRLAVPSLLLVSPRHHPDNTHTSKPRLFRAEARQRAMPGADLTTRGECATEAALAAFRERLNKPFRRVAPARSGD